MFDLATLTIDTKMKIINGSKKQEIDFKFPNIVETKESFCGIHNAYFTQETQILPSGKEHKTSCPQCQIYDEKTKSKEFVINELKQMGYTFDRMKGKWSFELEPIEKETALFNKNQHKSNFKIFS